MSQLASSARFRVAMAQVNPLIGDIHGNTSLVLESARLALQQDAHMVVFPELTLTGYSPEDLLLRPGLDGRIATALERICAARLPLYLVLGYPGRQEGELYNMLAVIHEGQIIGRYCKQRLPNYQVFDEKRYFKKGGEALLLSIAGMRMAFSICEDLWDKTVMQQAAVLGARLMININGSPYHRNKVSERRAMLQQRVLEGGMPLIYVNQVGGQDELVFDGASMALDIDGRVQVQAPQFAEALSLVDLQLQSPSAAVPAMAAGQQARLLERDAELYEALVLGLRDYVNKNRFSGVLLGLSGGIDSALTLALAVDALGAERVQAVMMPFEHTSAMSLEDAQLQATTLAVDYRVIPIAPAYEAFTEMLAGEFAGRPSDLSEQNLQARCRAVILMAISNKKGGLVLTTGNKSEIAVGYSTLYGDMAGGFDALKDVPKMEVYALARYRNARDGSAVIPPRVLERAPSAELAPNQLDEDSLAPYPLLDRILELYVEQDLSAAEIVAQGFEQALVEKIVRLVDLNEYKRRQAPIGVRVSERAFGRDRRYPITSGWRMAD